MVTNHEALGTSRCELHTKPVEFAADPLECYSHVGGVISLMGKGACRTKELTQSGPQHGTRYGYMQIEWVSGLSECETACRSSVQPCFGIEYHPTANERGLRKCEVHFEELSASQMSTMECWVKVQNTVDPTTIVVREESPSTPTPNAGADEDDDDGDDDDSNTLVIVLI